MLFPWFWVNDFNTNTQNTSIRGGETMKWLKNWGWGFFVLIVVGGIGGVLLLALPKSSGMVEEVQDEKITLTFRHFWTKEHDKPMLAIFERIIEQFQKDNPNVKVSFEGMDQTVHREQKLKSEMVTGTPPDMFVLFGGAEIEPYACSNRLMDLTDFVHNNGWSNSFKDLKLWTFNERIYGLPIEGNAEPLYYNRAIFKSLGIKEPITIEELSEAIVTLKKNGYTPFALGNVDRWPAAIYAHYLMDRYAGPKLFEQIIQGSNISYLNDQYLLAFKQLEHWIAQGAFSAAANNLSTEQAIQTFTSEQAAMYLNGNWDINLFQDNDVDVSFREKVGVIPFPALKPDSPRSMAGGYTIGIGLSSALEEGQKEAALKLLKSFFTSKVQSQIVYAGLRIPAVKIPFDSKETGSIFMQVMNVMEHSEGTFVPYDNVLSPEVKKSFLKVIEEMIEGNMNAEQALATLQSSSLDYWKQRDNALP